MQRALAAASGLPSSSTSALWMLVFLMPAEVRSNFMLSLRVTTIRADGLHCPRDLDSSALAWGVAKDAGLSVQWFGRD
jgi:hypothetical protein